jgi:hypothetical protein
MTERSHCRLAWLLIGEGAADIERVIIGRRLLENYGV